MQETLISLLYLAAIPFIVGAVIYWQIAVHRRLKGLKKCFFDTPAKSIAETGEGPAVIQGRAVALSPLDAPISGKPVVGYRVTVDQAVRHGQRDGWKRVFDWADIKDFEVDDGSGRARVRGTGARLIFDREYRSTNGLFSEMPRRLRRLLEQNGISTRGILLDKSFRWAEYYLDQDEAVCVYGVARWELDTTASGGNYRQAPQRLVIQAPPDSPVIVVDKTREDFLKEF